MGNEVRFRTAGTGPRGTSRIAGTVAGEAVEVLIPTEVLKAVGGHNAQLTEVILPALEREARGKGHPWGDAVEAAADQTEEREDGAVEFLCPRPDCERSEPGTGWKTERSLRNHLERDHEEEE